MCYAGKYGSNRVYGSPILLHCHSQRLQVFLTDMNCKIYQGRNSRILGIMSVLQYKNPSTKRNGKKNVWQTLYSAPLSQAMDCYEDF